MPGRDCRSPYCSKIGTYLLLRLGAARVPLVSLRTPPKRLCCASTYHQAPRVMMGAVQGPGLRPRSLARAQEREALAALTTLRIAVR